MITINKLRIDDTLKNIEVEVVAGTTAARFTHVFVWDHLTFRNYEKAKDVSSLLAKTSNTETFSIPAEQLGVERIDNVYFVEFRTNEDSVPLDNGLIQNQILGVVANLFQYKECLLDKSQSVDVSRCGKADPNCYSCQDSIYSFNLLSSLMQALDAGIQTNLFDEVVKILKDIDKICENCDGCPDYEDTRALNGAGLGYQVIQNEIVDSGVQSSTNPDPDTCVTGTCGPAGEGGFCSLVAAYDGTATQACADQTSFADLCYSTPVYFSTEPVVGAIPLFSDAARTQPVTGLASGTLIFRRIVEGGFSYFPGVFNASASSYTPSPCIPQGGGEQ